MSDSSPQPFVILRGEYAVLKGEGASIAAPNATNGTVVLLCDEENKIVSVAHLDGEENLAENLQKIFDDLAQAGADFRNLKCTIMSKNSDLALEKALSLRGLVVDNQTWGGTHAYNVVAGVSGDIAVDNSSDSMRKYFNQVLFEPGGEKRLAAAMSGQIVELTRKEPPTRTPKLSNVLRLVPDKDKQR